MSKDDIQLMMYGTSDMDAFVASVEESLAFKTAGPGLVIMSLLSDAQEELQGGPEDACQTARQTINRAKFLVRKYLLTPAAVEAAPAATSKPMRPG